VSSVPFLSYEVTLPPGFTASSSTPLTITFVNPDGPDFVQSNLPLQGQMLWPGASATPPLMWPGWELLPDGTYVETDGNFAWTRDGVLVMFDVNPHFETTVNYPPEAAICVNPPHTGVPTDPSVTPTDVPTTVSAGLPGGAAPAPSSQLGQLFAGIGFTLTMLSIIALFTGRPRGSHQA
jgi:hypothetical protein